MQPITFATEEERQTYRDTNLHKHAPDWKPDRDYWDQFEHASQIASFIELNGSPDDPLLATWEQLTYYDTVIAENFPTEEELAGIIKQFDDRPHEEKLKIFGGWDYFRWDRASVQENFETEIEDMSLETFLVIEATDPGGKQIITNDFKELLTDGSGPRVLLHIKVGTRRDEVAAGLRAFVETLEAHWDSLISDPEFQIPERAGQSK